MVRSGFEPRVTGDERRKTLRYIRALTLFPTWYYQHGNANLGVSKALTKKYLLQPLIYSQSLFIDLGTVPNLTKSL